MKFYEILKLYVGTCITISCVTAEVFKNTLDAGGWLKQPINLLPDIQICNLDVRNGSLTQDEFITRYAYNVPVVLRNVTKNALFTTLCSKHNLSINYGNLMIRLSSANSYSYDKVDVQFSQYLDEMLMSKTLSPFGNETFYFFGDALPEELNSLLQFYNPPPYYLPNLRPALSFGIAGAGTGVPFHFHGPGFGEVIYGRKHWFFYEPEREPNFNPNETTLHWFLNEYTKLDVNEKPLECTIGPGEIIYFPDRWWHGTLNLDTSVFISTFFGPP